MLASEPVLEISLTEFLCGAHESVDWCRQRFEDYIGDIDRTWDPESEEPLLEHPAYAIALSSDSVLLIHRQDGTGEIVGYFNAPGAVCIQPAHQGKGLGAELILATALYVGGAPTAPLDEQCFSAAGLAATRAAWRLGVSRGLIRDPAARLRKGGSR